MIAIKAEVKAEVLATAETGVETGDGAVVVHGQVILQTEERADLFHPDLDTHIKVIKCNFCPASEQIGSLELNLPPVQRPPALILISELGMEIHRSRGKKKQLQTGILTSNLKFRAEVIGNSRKHQDGKHELTNWIDDQLIIPDANTERNLPPVVVNSVAVDTSHGPM